MGGWGMSTFLNSLLLDEAFQSYASQDAAGAVPVTALRAWDHRWWLLGLAGLRLFWRVGIGLAALVIRFLGSWFHGIVSWGDPWVGGSTQIFGNGS